MTDGDNLIEDIILSHGARGMVKADSCGTATEQLRARVYWTRISVPGQMRRCLTCADIDIKRTTLGCLKHGFSTLANAVCDEWTRGL